MNRNEGKRALKSSGSDSTYFVMASSAWSSVSANFRAHWPPTPHRSDNRARDVRRESFNSGKRHRYRHRAEGLPARASRERRPGIHRHLTNAGDVPVANTARERRRQARLLVVGELHATIGCIAEHQRLELALVDVLGAR